MLGLGYESSDEEEAVALPPKEASPKVVIPPETTLSPSLDAPRTTNTAHELTQGPSKSSTLGPSVTPPPGPAGPAGPSQDGPPQSPHSFVRMEIQRLTLPTVPNFDIPETPPGSPPQASTKKFKNFLDLKKKGQHFNQRLENSSVLRDPSQLQRLMDLAGISEEDSYASTLSEDVAIPTTFPNWAYVEELSKSHKSIKKAKEEEKAKAPRTKVDFVPATGSGGSSNRGTPSGRSYQSAADNSKGVLSSDGDQSSSQGHGKRKELEHRDKRTKFR